ncbi:MAG: serine acetyltransferase [Oscillospiraceae bacterium]|nr:serine acetyltransferase [Oscillospiraceae bacterium]
MQNRSDFNYYIKQDALAMRRQKLRPKLFGDEIWKYMLSLRRLEYYSTLKGISKFLHIPLFVLQKARNHNLGMKLGFSIPPLAIGPGLSLAHYPGIIINRGVRIGKNCRIHQGVTIGATNGSPDAPIIGDNCFIGCGAVILGKITIADNVAIGANSVLTKSITEPSTTWAGAPARKCSDHDSHCHLSPLLKLN